MSVRVLSKAATALIRNENAKSYPLLCTALQNVYRGEIVKVEHKKFPQGIIEKLEFMFLDDTKLRVSFFVSNDGKSKITMKEV